MVKQEILDSISHDKYEPIRAKNSEQAILLLEEAIRENNETVKMFPAPNDLIYNKSEVETSVSNSINNSNAMILTTSDLAKSLVSDLKENESVTFQDSMEAIIVSSGKPEIHSQYELATIEEQPELGYQSDSSDTDSLYLSSITRSKNTNNITGIVCQNVKRKPSNTFCTLSESSEMSSLETTNKILDPVIEDLMEDNHK